MAALGIEAAIALTVGILNLRSSSGLEITKTIPATDAKPIVIDAPPTTEPIVSDATVSDTKEPDEDTMLLDDEKAIARTLASEYTIVVGGRMYTPYRLYRHSIDDYIAAGITPEEVKKRGAFMTSLILTQNRE